jgi:integrase
MDGEVANRKVSLLWYCRTPRGWRRFPVVMGRNNRIRHSYVMDGGVEISYPEGRYELLMYEGRKPVYKRAGDNAADAMAARDREANLLVAKETASAAGARVVEEEHRKYIRRAADRYIQDCENRKAMEAAEQARLVTDEFMEVTRKTFVDEIVKDDIYRFHRALRERGCGDRTIANKHARLKSFLKFAGVDVKTVMPPEPRYEESLPTIYSGEEIRAILKAADPYMHLVVEMGLKLGLRDQELTYAEWTDIDWQHSVFRVQGKPARGFKVKDSEQRDIPIPSDLLARLKEWREKHPKTKLILGTENDAPNEKMLRLLKRLAKRAGLNCGQCDGCKGELKECQNWTLHKLRRTYATTLLRNGLDLKTTQHYMGHADLASTMRYLRPASTAETQNRINAIVWN